ALRTISASYAPIASHSSAGLNPGLASTSRSGCSRRRARPSGPSESLSSTRYAMVPRSAGRQAVGQDGLGRSHAAPVVDGRAEVPQRQLERREPGHDVEAADVAGGGEEDDTPVHTILHDA